MIKSCNRNKPSTAAPEDAVLIAWKKFSKKYKREEDCIEALYQMLHKQQAVRCGNCAASDLERPFGKRLGTCRTCRKEVSITAGTFFDSIRKVRPWLAAIWFLEQGVSISTNRFHKLLGIAYSTAWMMHRKISFVLNSWMDTENQALVVDSQRFAPAICKRSRETPANQHPHAEKTAIKTQVKNGQSRLRISLLEQHFARKRGAEADSIPDARLLREAFHGVSWKYLQIYLAVLWCQSDTARWSSGCLFEALSGFRRVYDSEILQFISPLFVRVMPTSTIGRLSIST